MTISLLPPHPIGPIVRLSPTGLSRWARCHHQFLLRNVLPVPVIDVGDSANEGLKVHAMLKVVHTGGSCQDSAWRREVVDQHDTGDGQRLDGYLERHARKCPEGAGSFGHEHGLSRFARNTSVMLMAYGTIDAIWIHDGVLDARDYKTGNPSLERVDDDPAAYVQAFLLAPLAQERGLALRIRYEMLAPEAGEDPEDFDVDDEALAKIERRLLMTAERIKDEVEWVGTTDARICNFCSYRSICSVRAAGQV